MEHPHVSPDSTEEFRRRAAASPPRTVVGELWGFVAHTGKWWLAPILLVILLLGALLLFGGAVGPFIYTLF